MGPPGPGGRFTGIEPFLALDPVLRVRESSAVSHDYTVHVKTRRRSLKSVRAAAISVLSKLPGASLAPAEEESQELHVTAPRASGVVRVTLHGFGVGFVVLPAAGEGFNGLPDLVNEIAAELGTVLGEEATADLLEKEAEEAEAARSVRNPLANMVTLSVLDAKGKLITQVRDTYENFSAQQVPGGMLQPALVNEKSSPLLSDAGRYPLRGALLRCVVHDDAANPYRQYDFELDGYGRITSFSVSQP